MSRLPYRASPEQTKGGGLEDVCVLGGIGGSVRCVDPMHSRSRLQTNARGVETGVEGVYESSREKF